MVKHSNELTVAPMAERFLYDVIAGGTAEQDSLNSCRRDTAFPERVISCLTNWKYTHPSIP